MMVSCIRDKMIFIHSSIDFYDFQIKFLQEFPEEAGKKEKKKNITLYARAIRYSK